MRLKRKSVLPRTLSRSVEAPLPNGCGSQLEAAILLGDQLSVDSRQRVYTGVRCSLTRSIAGLSSVKKRLTSMKCKQAFVSGLIAVRSLPPGHGKSMFRAIGSGWYKLKGVPSNSIVESLCGIAKRNPGRIRTIFGKSFTELCRNPTYDFSIRIGAGWKAPIVLEKFWRGVDDPRTLDVRKFRTGVPSFDKSIKSFITSMSHYAKRMGLEMRKQTPVVEHYRSSLLRSVVPERTRPGKSVPRS